MLGLLHFIAPLHPSPTERTNLGYRRLQLVLLLIPSSHLNPQTIPQFVQIQIRRFLSAIYDGFETSVL